MITNESTWNPNTINEDGPWLGLTQIHPRWLRAEDVGPYRLTDDHRSRDLYDPYEHLLTAIEIWTYAVNVYNIDPFSEQGIRSIMHWHSSGRFSATVRNARYIRNVQRWINEMIPYEVPEFVLSPEDIDFEINLDDFDFEIVFEFSFPEPLERLERTYLQAINFA
jgi:hypothetical protein